MINMPYVEHDLKGKISSNLPGCNLMLTNAGINGQTISEIKSRLDTDVIMHKSDAVILFWNSDCTKRSEEGKTPEEVQIMRDEYAADLSYVIDGITDSGAKLAVAGPAILGESYGLFMPVSNQYYH
jgi:hypothetical protein